MKSVYAAVKHVGINLGTQIVTAQNGRWLHAKAATNGFNGMWIHQSTSGMDCGANNKGFQE